MLRSEQQRPSVSSQIFLESHYLVHKSKVNEENKALGGFGGKTKPVSVLCLFILKSALPFWGFQG